MDNQETDANAKFSPKIVREKRRSIFDPERPPATPHKNIDQSYKAKLEREIEEWAETLRKKYLCTKHPPPQLKQFIEDEDEPKLKLTEAQEIYLSQAPNFHQMIADRKEFVKTIEYYLNLRSHVVEDIEYRHKMLNSIANKAVRDIISKAIYE